MSEWLNNPVVVLATIAVAGALLTAGQWIGRVNADIESFKGFVDEIRRDIKEIRASVNGLFKRLPPAPITSNSPLALTELGDEISEELSGKEWAKRTAEQFLRDVRGKEPYEIQDICFDYVKSQFEPDDEQDAQIRACAYNHALKREQVLDVLAIELRDTLLAIGESAE